MYKLPITTRLLIAAILLAFLCLIASLGCSSAKKDQQAVNRVMGSPELQAQAGKLLGRESDTVVINTERVITDTLRVVQPGRPVIDSGCLAYENYLNSLVFSTNRLIDTLLKNGVRVVISSDGIKASYTERTQRTVLRDRSEANRWRDSADNLRRMLIVVSERMAVLEREKNTYQQENQSLKDKLATFGKKSKVPWWLWVVIGLAAVIGVGGFLFRKVIPWVMVVDAAKTIFSFIQKRKK